MTRLGSLISCAVFALGAALTGCGGGGSSGGTGGSISGTGGSGGGGAGGQNADSGSAPSVLDLIPQDGAIAGWTVDPSNSKTAGKVAATATTEIDTEALIDGAAADFFAAPYTPTIFAWQNYVNANVTDAPDGAFVTLYILQMPTAQQASGLYTSLLGASLYVGKTWTEPSSTLVGTDSRIADTGDHWWINFYKGNYYVEVSLGPSAGPAPDFTPGDEATKAAAFAFATAVAAQL